MSPRRARKPSRCHFLMVFACSLNVPVRSPSLCCQSLPVAVSRWRRRYQSLPVAVSRWRWRYQSLPVAVSRWRWRYQSLPVAVSLWRRRYQSLSIVGAGAIKRYLSFCLPLPVPLCSCVCCPVCRHLLPWVDQNRHVAAVHVVHFGLPTAEPEPLG